MRFMSQISHRNVSTWTSQVAKIMVQYPKVESIGRVRVHYFAVILPTLSVLGYGAIVLGIGPASFTPYPEA